MTRAPAEMNTFANPNIAGKAIKAEKSNPKVNFVINTQANTALEICVVISDKTEHANQFYLYL